MGKYPNVDLHYVKIPYSLILMKLNFTYGFILFNFIYW